MRFPAISPRLRHGAQNLLPLPHRPSRLAFISSLITLCFFSIFTAQEGWGFGGGLSGDTSPLTSALLGRGLVDLKGTRVVGGRSLRLRGGGDGTRVVEDVEAMQSGLEKLQKLSLEPPSPKELPPKSSSDPISKPNRASKNISGNEPAHRSSEMISLNVTATRIDHWKLLAEQNNAQAMYNLGLCYYSGVGGVSVNYETAYDWFFKAAEKGFPDAKFNLGVLCQLGKGVPASQTAAMEWYLEAAQMNVTEAMNNLAKMYQSGVGGEKNLKKAFKYFLAAADLGNGDAMYNVGLAYYHGNGTSINLQEALEWFQACSAVDNKSRAKAEFMLGNMYFHGQGLVETDYKEAVFWYKSAAERGYPQAQLHIGRIFLGSQQYKAHAKVGQEAIRFLRLAGENGMSEAWHLLGQYYVRVSNTSESFLCFKRAFDGGFIQSLSVLGSCYEHGIGTKVDLEKAFELHSTAAKKGYIGSMNALGSMYLEGKGVERDEEEALEWYIKSADHGDANGQVQVAMHKMYGQGCDVNMQEARSWLRKAASQGNERAKELLKQHFTASGT
ncbi:hypothetical protein AAMO2058_001156500 [Amorphochlora amoebiformis]